MRPSASAGNGFNLGDARGSVTIDPSGVSSGLAQAEREIQGFAQRFGGQLQGIGGQLSSFGSQMTAAFTVPLTAFGAAGISTAATFEDSMAEIAARTGLTGDALDSIREKALQLGADTKFSAQQSADAFLQLLASGMDVDEAFASIDAILAGAAASGSDFGIVADQVTNILASMGLEAERAGDVVQAMNNAAATSPSTMTEIGEAMAMGGGIAAQYGIELDELAGIFSIFANNNIRGSEAATQLRSMMLNMTRDTPGVRDAWNRLGTSLYDAEGNLRDLNTVFAEMDAAMQGMSTEEQNEIITELAGIYGILGFNAIRNSVGIEAMTEKMDEQADVADVAAARMATFNGQMTSLRGSMETFLIRAFTPTIEAMTPYVTQLVGVVNQASAWVEANEALTQQIIKVASVVAAAGPVLFVLGKVISGIGVAIAFALSPMGLFVGALTAIGVAYQRNLGGFADFVQRRLIPNLRWMAMSVREIAFSFRNLFNLLSGRSELAILPSYFAPIVVMFRRVQDAASRLRDAVVPMFREIGIFAVRNMQPIIDVLGRVMQAFSMLNPVGAFMGLLRIFQVDVIGIFETVTEAIQSFFAFLNAGAGVVSAFGLTIMTTFGLNAYIAFNRFRNAITEAMASVQTALTAAIPIVQGFFVGMRDAMVDAWNVVYPRLAAFADWFLNRALPPIIAVVGSFIGLVGALANTLVDLWRVAQPHLANLATWFLDDALPDIGSFIIDTALPAISDFIDILKKVWTDVSPFLVQLADWFLTSALPPMRAAIEQNFMPMVDNMIGLLQDLWTLVQPYLANLYDWFINTGLPAVMNFIEGPVTVAINAYIALLAGIWNGVSAGVTALRNNLETIFNFIVDNLIEPTINAIDRLIGAFERLTGIGDLGGQLNEIANNLDGVSPSQFWDILTGAIQNEFQGGFADGGDFMAGRPMIVGERGPEMLVPRSSGTVIPNEAMGGVRLQVDAINVYNPPQGQTGQSIVDELDAIFARSGVNYSMGAI